MEKQKIKISVRNLVEFILRSGDIDNRIAAMDKDAMQLGSKIHRKIQRQMGAGYQAEVSLKYELLKEEFVLLIEGRADGIILTEEGAVIDEIKGVLKDLTLISEPSAVHLAQAKCYACIYGLQHELEDIGVQMTYCNMETEEVKRFQERYKMKELHEWFESLAQCYVKWARLEAKWKEKRNDSIKKLDFPYPYREGQKNLVVSVYKTILRKKKLFIQAPTGVGKTMASVFPAVKALGEGLGEKLFYLTAKTITRTAAIHAFEVLRNNGLFFKSITLTAKDKICFCTETECNPDVCVYAKGHYDRINDAIYELLAMSDELCRETIEQQARKCKVCPFELGLDLSLWADAVICDYNYVFDPNAHLKRFFGEGVKGGHLFLIDEAHNLVERGREMYSAVLYKEDILKVRKLIRKEDGRLSLKLTECNTKFLELKRECEGCQVLNSAAHIYLNLLSVFSELERFLEECTDETVRKEVLEFYFNVRTFLYVYERLDENYLIYTEIETDGRFKIKLFCVNPSVGLKEFLDKGNSTVFFSATLLPIHYYKKLLSTGTEDYAVYAHSFFDTSRRLLLMGTDVSTRYTRRGEETYRRYAQYLQMTALAQKGNYMAFFPSYRFLEAVYDEFLKLEEGRIPIDCVVQASFMSEESREIFLENFEEDREGSMIAFCVMGGIFSEGIDLTEDKLIGAVIIGTGIPQICRERELLKEYFDQRSMPGFDYAYVYPGINKVLQSAGRVIRTEEDKGVILLLDDRFRERRYQDIFPREWQDIRLCSIRSAAGQITAFWE